MAIKIHGSCKTWVEKDNSRYSVDIRYFREIKITRKKEKLQEKRQNKEEKSKISNMHMI